MATNQPQTPEQQLQVLPILMGAMTMGVVMFGGVSVFLALTGQGGSGGAGTTGSGAGAQASGVPDVMWAALGAVAFVGVVGYLVVGSMARTRGRRVWEERSDDEVGHAALVRLLVVTTIARGALAEGFGLFGGVLILMYADLVPLAAMAVSVAMMAALLPVGSRFRSLQEAATGVRGGGYDRG